MFHTLSHYVEVLAITKFKICQCIRMIDSPNLMLAKVSRYTVYYENSSKSMCTFNLWLLRSIGLLTLHRQC